MAGIEHAKVVHEDLRKDQRRCRDRKTHILGDVGYERVAVIEFRAPHVGLRLQPLDMGHHAIVLILVHQYAIARRSVFVLEVAVGPSGFGRDRHIMPDHPRRRVVANRRKSGNAGVGGRLTDPAMNDIGVAVVPSIARAEFDVVGARATGDDGCCAGGPNNLFLGAVLRACRSEPGDEPCERGDCDETHQPKGPAPGAAQRVLHGALRRSQRAIALSDSGAIRLILRLT